MKNKSSYDNINLINLSPEFPRKQGEPNLLGDVAIESYEQVPGPHGVSKFDLTISPGSYRVRVWMMPLSGKLHGATGNVPGCSAVAPRTI